MPLRNLITFWTILGIHQMSGGVSVNRIAAGVTRKLTHIMLPWLISFRHGCAGKQTISGLNEWRKGNRLVRRGYHISQKKMNLNSFGSLIIHNHDDLPYSFMSAWLGTRISSRGQNSYLCHFP